jgi:hypothetical protein
MSHAAKLFTSLIKKRLMEFSSEYEVITEAQLPEMQSLRFTV